MIENFGLNNKYIKEYSNFLIESKGISEINKKYTNEIFNFFDKKKIKK